MEIKEATFSFQLGRSPEQIKTQTQMLEIYKSGHGWWSSATNRDAVFSGKFPDWILTAKIGDWLVGRRGLEVNKLHPPVEPVLVVKLTDEVTGEVERIDEWWYWPTTKMLPSLRFGPVVFVEDSFSGTGFLKLSELKAELYKAEVAAKGSGDVGEFGKRIDNLPYGQLHEIGTSRVMRARVPVTWEHGKVVPEQKAAAAPEKKPNQVYLIQQDHQAGWNRISCRFRASVREWARTFYDTQIPSDAISVEAIQKKLEDLPLGVQIRIGTYRVVKIEVRD